MSAPTSMFVPVQVGYCTVYLHTVGLTPGYNYLVSCDDAGVGFASPVMVYQSPTARFGIESPLAIGHLMGLRVIPTMAVIPAPPSRFTRRARTPSPTLPRPAIQPAPPSSAPGLGWTWSSPVTSAAPQVSVTFSLFLLVGVYSGNLGAVSTIVTYFMTCNRLS